jgi:hypothetical protein
MPKIFTSSEHIKSNFAAGQNIFRRPSVETLLKEIDRLTADNKRLEAIAEAVRERTKDALGIFDGGHGKRYAYCNDCHAIGETLDQGSIKHHRGCLVDALQAADKPGG